MPEAVAKSPPPSTSQPGSVRWAGLLAVLVATVGGCRCAPDPRPEGTLVVLVENAPESLDRRFTLSANGQRIASLIAPGLVRIDAAGKAVPELAERFERVGETRYRFTLRSGLTFHDGSPLEAADVVYTYESLVDPDVGSPLGPRFEAIESVEAVDPLTVDFVLAEPFAPLLVDLTMGIVPRWLADPERRAAYEEHPVGAGPFRLEARPDEEHVVLSANPDWYAGTPPIPRIEFVVVRDETTRVLSLLHGDADLAFGGVSPVLLPRLDAAKHLEVRREPGPGYAYLGFNVRHEILADRRVRVAIAHALDRAEIAEFKFKGAARLAQSMLPESHWAFAAGETYDYDPEKARALLDEAGFPDPDGDGPAPRFVITYKTSTDRFRKSVALILKEQLEAVGVGIDLRAYEWGTFYGDVKRGRFEITTLKWTPVIEPHLYQWVFHSDSIPTEENGWVGGNRGGYSDSEVDAWIDAAAKELDPEKRAALYGKVQARLAHDLPYVSLWHEDSVAIVHRRIRDLDISPFGFLHPLAKARLE